MDRKTACFAQKAIHRLKILNARDNVIQIDPNQLINFFFLNKMMTQPGRVCTRNHILIFFSAFADCVEYLDANR